MSEKLTAYDKIDPHPTKDLEQRNLFCTSLT